MGEAAFGALFKVGDGATSEAFTALAEVVSIGGPSLSQEVVDVTHMSSTAGYREFKASVRDGGEVTLDVNFLPAATDHIALLQTDFEAGTVRNFEVVWTDTASTNWQFAGIVTGWNPNHPLDGKAECSITVKVTGQPTWSP